MMSGFLGAMQHTEAGLMHYTPYLIDGPVLIRDNKINQFMYMYVQLNVSI